MEYFLKHSQRFQLDCCFRAACSCYISDLRYTSDKIIITTRYVHIKLGVLNPEEIDIPLSKINILEVSQSSMGRLLNYGSVSFSSNSERFDYGYIQAPEELQYIIDDPARFVKEALEDNDFEEEDVKAEV